MEARRQNKGYVVLLAMIIVSVLGAALAASLLYRGGLSANTAAILERSIHARNFADACAEEALLVITQSEAYTGSGNLDFDTGTCEYEVQVNGMESNVHSTGYMDDALRRNTVLVQRNTVVGEFGTTSEIVAADWAEVAEF